MKTILVIITLLFTACNSTSNQSSTSAAITNHSGFLNDYDKLKKVKTKDDSELLRYISSQVKEGKYTKVMFDPVSYYPAPQKTDMISKEVLSKISNYFNQKFSETAFTNVELVNNAGMNTLRIKMAITGVNIEDSELSAYQYIPLAFLINAASGGMSEMDVKFQIEAEVVDSLTGEVLAAAVKRGVGERLKDDKTSLSLKHLKPLIDNWAMTMQKTMLESL
ncbi:MAG: DUF3313 domain-containing protein [Colwellia sp.]|nr:DUF3313 domain-containing protein [Colwellia sp.]